MTRRPGTCYRKVMANAFKAGFHRMAHGLSAGPIAAAVCEALCGPVPIITAIIENPRPLPEKTGDPVAGMVDSGPGESSSPVRGAVAEQSHWV